MATFFSSTYVTMLVFLSLFFEMLLADPSSTFSFQNFAKGSNFGAKVAFFGDAKAVANGSSLQLTDQVKSSAGRVMYKKPIKLVEGNPGNLASFSTYFSFLMSPDNGGGLTFFMVPSGFNFSVVGNSSFGLSLGPEKNNSELFVVEFDTSSDGKHNDTSDTSNNHAGIDVGSFISVKTRDVSPIYLAYNGGKRLYSWVDYIAGSKRLEVRLSQFDNTKPIDPLLWHSIDLSQMWSDEEVLIGLSSSNGNSSRTCFLYSWSFELKRFPHWMHSQPLDPQMFSNDTKPVIAHKRTHCVLKVITAMIFGTACGAFGAFIVLYLWTIFGNRRPVVPEECSVHPTDFEYKKVKVVVDKAIKDGKQ